MHPGDAMSGSAHIDLLCRFLLRCDRNIPRSAIALKVIQRTVFLLDNLLGNLVKTCIFLSRTHFQFWKEVPERGRSVEKGLRVKSPGVACFLSMRIDK